MDWFKGQFTGKPHISWENLWFPVDFPLNQSIDFDHGAFGEIQSSGYGIKLKNPGGDVQELGDTGTDLKIRGVPR